MAAQPATLADVLDDLAIRFIVNVPTEELASFERICFQIEQAFWFYDDFYRERDQRLPRMHLRDFAIAMFNHVPILKPFANRFDVIFQKFLDYKYRVPVCGAVLLTPGLDKCLLVKGWSSGAGWSFPRGKINQGEEMDKCAIREVYEEVGFDIEPLLQPETYLEHIEHGHAIRLYIVQGVAETTAFQTLTRKEISRIEWFDLSALPSAKETDGNASKFWSVLPFVGKLRRWVKDHSPNKAKPRASIGSASSTSLAQVAAVSSASGTVGPPVAARTPAAAPPVAVPASAAAGVRPAPRPGVALSWPPLSPGVNIGRSLLDFRLDRTAIMAALVGAP